MATKNKEGQSCPGDDAMEVKRAILLNTLDPPGNSATAHAEKKATGKGDKNKKTRV